MHWIILCIFSATCYSICAFIDNYNTDVLFKGKKPQAIKAINGYLYLIIATIIAVLFGIKSTSLPIALIALLSGLIASLASVPYYLALRSEEATTGAIFYQLIPVFCVFADIFLLGKPLTLHQALGFAIIMSAPFIIVLSRRRKKAQKLEILAALFFLAYVVLISISNVIYAKIELQRPDTMTIFFWFTLGRAIFDISTSTFMPSWRKRIKQVRKTHPLKIIIMASLTLGISCIADFVLRFAFNETNTSLATVISNTSELIITFVLGIILTLIWPSFGREKLNRHIIISHLIATIVVVVGIIITQI